MTKYIQTGLQLRVAVPGEQDRLAAPLPGFLEPPRPDAAMIELIHRGHDRFISIHRKDESGELRNVCSIPARCLPGLFGQMVDLLDAESFFSINGMYRGAPWQNKHGLVDNEGKPLPDANRTRKDARWITSCYADIDCRKLGIEVGDAIGAVIKAQDRKLLPPASIIMRSGNGIWLFWLVTGADHKGNSECLPAFPNLVDKWAAVQGAIHNRLVTLGADANALDVPRVTRIPGSINAKAGVRVAYWVQYAADATVPKYTLTELAEAFGVRPKVLTPTVQRVSTIYQARGHKGQAGRWLKAKENFMRLWKLRGTWKVGTRDAAVFVYSVILRSLPGRHRMEEVEIEGAIEELFRDFEQRPDHRYTIHAAFATLRSTLETNELAVTRRKDTKLAAMRNQTIADRLEITPEEVDLLQLTWPAARRFNSQSEPQTKLKRQEIAIRRRAIIAQTITRNGGEIPSTRRLAEIIERAGLDQPSTATVSADLRAMGMGGKPDADGTDQPTLF